MADGSQETNPDFDCFKGAELSAAKHLIQEPNTKIQEHKNIW